MNLRDLSIQQINIPFKVSFKHSSAERAATQSIWVEAVSANGTSGYGEGCPREYVTNESPDTAFTFFNKHKDAIIEQVHDIDDLKSWMLYQKTAIDQNPAAWCAIELALLDLMAKENKQSIENILGLPPVQKPFQYSAILGDSGIEVFTAQLEKYLAMGFTDFKIKISGNIEKDREKLKLLHKSSTK
ncbi:MAG: hypothetical protein K2X86_09150, partial [Cytophagaceae bacterium]|nr:hypothetical protein [Cytophagaceae bacterium]